MKSSDPSFESVEPLPTFYDTACAIGVAGLCTAPVVIVPAILQAVGVIGPVASIVAPLAFVAALLWRTSRRAALNSGSGTPRRRGSLRYDVLYAVALACVTPILLLPAVMMYAPVGAAVTGPVLLVVALVAGATLLVVRRRQRADR